MQREHQELLAAIRARGQHPPLEVPSDNTQHSRPKSIAPSYNQQASFEPQKSAQSIANPKQNPVANAAIDKQHGEVLIKSPPQPQTVKKGDNKPTLYSRPVPKKSTMAKTPKKNAKSIDIDEPHKPLAEKHSLQQSKSPPQQGKVLEPKPTLSGEKGRDELKKLNEVKIAANSKTASPAAVSSKPKSKLSSLHCPAPSMKKPHQAQPQADATKHLQVSQLSQISSSVISKCSHSGVEANPVSEVSKFLSSEATPMSSVPSCPSVTPLNFGPARIDPSSMFKYVVSSPMQKPNAVGYSSSSDLDSSDLYNMESMRSNFDDEITESQALSEDRSPILSPGQKSCSQKCSQPEPHAVVKPPDQEQLPTTSSPVAPNKNHQVNSTTKTPMKKTKPSIYKRPIRKLDTLQNTEAIKPEDLARPLQYDVISKMCPRQAKALQSTLQPPVANALNCPYNLLTNSKDVEKAWKYLIRNHSNNIKVSH